MAIFACYVERGGHMAIGLFASRNAAKRRTVDDSKIAEVEAGGHYHGDTFPVFFTEQDQSYPELMAAVEAV